MTPLSPPKNPQFKNQKVSGTAHPLYAALRPARQNPDSSDSIQLWAPRVGPPLASLPRLKLFRQKVLSGHRLAPTPAGAGPAPAFESYSKCLPDISPRSK